MAYLCAVQEHFIGRGKVKCPVLFAGQILAWNVVCSSSLHLVLFFLNDKIRSHPQKRREFYCQSLLLLTKGCLSLPEPEHSAVTSKTVAFTGWSPRAPVCTRSSKPNWIAGVCLDCTNWSRFGLGVPQGKTAFRVKGRKGNEGKKTSSLFGRVCSQRHPSLTGTLSISLTP